MQISELVDRLRIAEAEEKPHPDQRISFIKGFVSTLDSEDKTAITALMGMLDFSMPPVEKQVLILLHGIRTAGVWQESIRQMFDGTGVEVIPIGYGYFDVFRFLIPGLREGPVMQVASQIQSVKRDNTEASISIIAHSFGTYILSKLLYPDQGLRFKKIVLCGSIISGSYAWENVQGRPSRNFILNDVGTRDVWPAFAETFTWGYGSSGTFGFKNHALQDRFHDLTHSDFFEELWVKKYWISFICDGVVHASAWDLRRPTPPVFLSLLTTFHAKYLIILIVILWWFY